MPAPISDLVNNISGSVSGLISDITGTGGAGPAMPTGKDVISVLSTINQENWMTLLAPYTFSVVDLDGTASENPFGDFKLPLPPTSITQSERPGSSSKKTAGGTSVNYSGNRHKILRISGTTGIAPFRGDGGVKRATGEAIFQPKELKYLSGFEVFLRLRNWFRAYDEYKAVRGKNAKSLRLVFKNYKDGEFLIVRLVDFTMDRSATRPFMYDYSMEFEVLAHYTFTEFKKNTFAFEDALTTVLDAVDTARGVLLRTQGILRQIEATYEAVVLAPLQKIALALKTLQGIPIVAADLSRRAVKNTVSAATTLAILMNIDRQKKENAAAGNPKQLLGSVFLPTDLQAAAVTQGADAILDLGPALMEIDVGLFPETTRIESAIEAEEARALPSSFYLQTLEELIRVKQNAEDFFNLGDSTYDSIFNRTATLSAASDKVASNDEFDVLFAFNEAISGLQLLLSTENLFKSTFDERIKDMVERFGNNISLFAQPAVKQLKYEGGMTLERIALKELGDSTRWGEIVEVNGLEAPFITDDASETNPYILKPGSNFLVPIPAVNGFSDIQVTKDNKVTKGLSTLERSLGVDFKLTPDFDLSLSNSGDLELVAGSSNMAQSIILKLSYGKGELLHAPFIGASLIPGQKFPSLTTIKDGLLNTLLQDSRVDTVLDLNIQREGSALYLTFKVKLKQIDIPVPIKIAVI